VKFFVFVIILVRLGNPFEFVISISYSYIMLPPLSKGSAQLNTICFEL